jgi:hypothetical protein
LCSPNGPKPVTITVSSEKDTKCKFIEFLQHVCMFKLDMIRISSSRLCSSHPTSLQPFPVFQMGTVQQISTSKWCMLCLSHQSQLYVHLIKTLISVSYNTKYYVEGQMKQCGLSKEKKRNVYQN